MNNNFALHLPFNSTSFGGIGFSLAYECFSRGLNPSIFPVMGQIDFSSQSKDDKFAQWLNDGILKGLKTHKRASTPAIRLWHTNQQSLESISDQELFITFIETSQITEVEKNILSQKKKVFVTSNYLKGICNNFGLTNVEYLPLGFDHRNFKNLNKKYWDDGRIVTNIIGKGEARKLHKKTIQSWLKKFGVPKTGVKTKYFMQAAIYNPFLVQNNNGQVIDHNNQFMAECCMGKEWGNIHFLGWMGKNAQYNDFLQSAQIVLGMGGGENFGAGEFHSVGLGSHSVIHNSNGYKDWADSNNSCLVQPCGMIDSHDGIFFHRGNIYQQGQFFDYSEDEFIVQCEEAIKRVENNPVNIEGQKLQSRTYKETLDILLKSI